MITIFIINYFLKICYNKFEVKNMLEEFLLSLGYKEIASLIWWAVKSFFAVCIVKIGVRLGPNSLNKYVLPSAVTYLSLKVRK